MADMKRQTAYKCCLSEIGKGNYVKGEGFTPGYVVTDLGRKVSRIRVLATVVNKFVNEDKTYGFIILDDSTDTIRVKIWQNIKIIEPIEIGDIVDVIGKAKFYDDEMYVMPEIVRKVDPNFEALRLVELADIWKDQKSKLDIVKESMKKVDDKEELKIYINEKHGIDPEFSEIMIQVLEGKIKPQVIEENTTEDKQEEKETEETGGNKEKILKIIEEDGNEDGVDFSTVLDKSRLDENDIDEVINDLLETGIIYEPRPGKFKKL